MESQSLIGGSHFKKLLRHGSLYMVATLAIKLGTGLLLPVYTHFLTPEEFGVYTNLVSWVGMIAIFVSLQLDFAYGRLLFDTNDDPEALRSLFTTLVLFVVLWGLGVVVVAFFLLRARVTHQLSVPAIPYLVLACTQALLMQLNALAGAHFRSHHQSACITVARCAGFAVGAAVSVGLLVGTEMGPLALLWGTALGALTVSIWYYWRIWHEGLVGGHFSLARLRESLFFSAGLLPMAVAAWIAGPLDNLLVTRYGGLEATGIYSVAFQLGRIVNMFVAALFMAYTPMIYAMLKDNAKKHVGRIEEFQSFLIHALVSMAFLISLFTPEAYRLLIGEDFHAGVGLVPIIAFAFVFGGLRKLYASLAYFHKLTLLISIGGILQAAISFGLNYWLIPKIGASAAAWARFASLAFGAAFLWVVSLKYQPLRIDWRSLGITLGIVGPCAIVVWLLGYGLWLSFWPLLGVKLLTAAALVGATWYSRFGREVSRVLSRKQAGQGPEIRPEPEPENEN